MFEPLIDLRQSWYHHGAAFIQYLQENHGYLENPLLQISKLGDPSMAFTLYFPIIAAINHRKGIMFLWTFVVSEWINHVGKWILAGDRPYWWIKENNVTITLRQTRLSCETGPGEPSGHCQASTIIWFCLLNAIFEALSPEDKRQRRPSLVDHVLKMVTMCVFVLMQFAMFFSRVFIAAHFPHQCFMGFLTAGMVLYGIYWPNRHQNQEDANSRTILSWQLLGAILMPLSAVGTYHLLKQQNFDPDWSLRLAQRWCQRPKEWIHVDTTPFYAMARYTGTAVGLTTLHVWSGRDVGFKNGANSLRDVILKILFGGAFGWTVGWVHTNLIPRHLGEVVFYSGEVLLNGLAVTVIACLPAGICRILFPTSGPAKKD